jgi:hypothetical protein
MSTRPMVYLGREAGPVQVLPAWSCVAGTLSLVYPGQRFVPATFIDTALASRNGAR